MKIMVIGNVGFDLMAPYLRGLGIRPILASVGDGRRHMPEAEKVHQFDRFDDWRSIVETAVEEQVDAAISISGPDYLNLRDSLVKSVLEDEYGLPVLANPIGAARIAIDKLKTKDWLASMGFPVTEGLEANSFQELREITDIYGYPVVVKCLHNSGGLGFRALGSPRQLKESAFGNFPVLVEKHVAGPEFSVEVLNHGGRTVPLVPVYKGLTDLEGIHPMERVKLAPAPIDPIDSAYLRSMAKKIVAGLDLQPTADVDFIWGPSGPQVLEINPRFGGVTALSMTASGIPVYSALVDMALGSWDSADYASDRAYAADLPVSSDIAPSVVADLLDTEGIFRVKLQKLKRTAGRIAMRAEKPPQLLRLARKAAALCDCRQDYYQELKDLVC